MTSKKKLYNFASILDEETRKQAIECSQLDIIYPHIALMPDAHLGLGATVGSVIATEKAIIPSAVGVDLGCGMIAFKTPLTVNDFEGKDLSILRKNIEKVIPLSAGHYNKTLLPSTLDKISILEEHLEILKSQTSGEVPPVLNDSDSIRSWKYQLGTLGSGNHFIEISKDEEDYIWIFLHSGSRGVGNQIATFYIDKSKKTCKDTNLPNKDLSYFREDEDIFRDYVGYVIWSQNFALQNRLEMLERVAKELEQFMGSNFYSVLSEDERNQSTIQCHHNFVQSEFHYGKQVWVTRKGAIEAQKGQFGLIPGSMGTASYIVVGKGNKISLNSSPHGAGRLRSRTASRKMFTKKDLEDVMGSIEYNRDSKAFIDEIPMAYKDINVVMEDSKKLVKIVRKLNQIINVKGD